MSFAQQVWRDVATNGHYAYVGAQSSSGNPAGYAIDLSNLSGDAGKTYAQDEDPIPAANITNFGAGGEGHTVNVARGMLFMNTASSRNGKGE